jgi:hypothetical protein
MAVQNDASRAKADTMTYVEAPALGAGGDCAIPFAGARAQGGLACGPSSFLRGAFRGLLLSDAHHR